MLNYDHEQISALKVRIAKLERTVNFLLQQLEYVDQPDEGADAPYLTLIRQNKKLDAIKLYRENTRAGLPEAKSYIDALELKA